MINWMLALASASVAVQAAGQAGSLDPTFGGDGIVTTTAGGSIDAGYAQTIQADGKILVAGRHHADSPYDDALMVRYNPDGSLDNTFGTGGKVITDYLGGIETAWSVLVQPDTRIVLAGTHWGVNNDDFAVFRYTSDGSPDQTFSDDGIMTLDIGGSSDYGWAAALQPDGKILVAGYDDSLLIHRHFAVLRLNTDGSLDDTFGGDGIVTTDMGAGLNEIRSLAVQPDGRILAAGTVYVGISEMHFGLVRYNPDGSLDDSFGADGKVITAVGQVDQASCVAVLPDGRILVAGSAFVGTYAFAMAHYTADGQLDTQFGTGGTVVTHIGQEEDNCNDMVVQPDGRIVLTGYTRAAGNWDIALVRYTSNGVLDPTMDGDGIVITPVGNAYDIGHALNMQADGKLVVAGWSYDSALNADVVTVVRYMNDAVGMAGSGDKGGLYLYPNPGYGMVSIDAQPDGGWLSVYRYSGELVLSKPLNRGVSSSIDLSGLARGCYAVRVTTGARVRVARLVLQ